jgi:acetoin utilization deacetylase AcuC-like enzyme
MPQRFAALFDTPTPSKPQKPQNRPMHKLILALAACNGISIKADATEDEALAAIAAHKPQSPNVVLNLEDPETKSRFDAAVSAGITAALPAAVEAATADIKASLTAVENLVRNGPAAAAGAGAPVPTVPAGGTKDEKPTMTNAAFRALSHPERNAFMASGGKLID